MILQHWFLAIRPKTLVTSLVPILAATSLAFSSFSDKNFKWLISVFALLSAICIQIGTNLVNDAIDFKKGADTAERLGPKRVSQSGLIPPTTVLTAGCLFFICAILFAIPLVFAGGLPIILIGIFSILCGYFYTAGPYSIAYNSLGEFFVFLFFGFAAVCGIAFLYTHTVTLPYIILSFQIGALASVILAVNNYRDLFTDKKVHKFTLAARFGKNFTRYEILFLYLLVYLLNIYWYFKYNFIVFMLTTLTIPIAILLVIGIFKNEPSKFINKYLGMAAFIEFLFGLLISFGFIFLK